MSYQYDLADFKRYLNNKNPKYRVDGLIFWQNRIPIPIDLFNRIFNESDQIVSEYVYQVVASAVTFSNSGSFEEAMSVEVTDLPKGDLKKQALALKDWLNENLPDNSPVVDMAYEIADIFCEGVPDKVTNSLNRVFAELKSHNSSLFTMPCK